MHIRAVFLIVLLFPLFLQASVTIRFSNPPLVVSDGFLDRNGVDTTGQSWGLVVDTGGDGFDGTGGLTYSPFNISSSGYLSVNGVQTDDFYVLGTDGPYLTIDAGASGDGSAIDIMIGIDVVTEGLGGDDFGIIWFDAGSANLGDYYGFLDSTVTMPNDGDTVDYSGTISLLTPGSADLIVAVPEPGAYALALGILGLGIVFYRRRCA